MLGAHICCILNLLPLPMLKHSHSLPLILLTLTKPVITLSVAFSALTGYILYAGEFASGWLYVYLGVLLVAAGSSVINQIQEIDADRLMDRTRHRPLPSARIGVVQAWIWAVCLVGSGMVLLWVFTVPRGALLAAFTLVWYNGVYTPLKRFSAWAIFPGALVGAVPPLIGWTTAGGDLGHPHIVLVAFFFFTGQIPHFWLISLRHGQDYQKAGFPSVTALFSHTQISRLTFLWTFATALIALWLPVLGVLQTKVPAMVLVVLSAGLIFYFLKWPGLRKPLLVSKAFAKMNLYFFLVMCLLIIDALIRN